MQYIKEIHDALRDKLGRAVRVLDLGCAQGYISLTVASWGAEVTGIDFYDKNIEVCNLLLQEHAGYHVFFDVARIEDCLTRVQAGQFDMVLGLSVFHHLCKMYGWEKVQNLLSELASKIVVGIFELALRVEPLQWANALPEDYRVILSGFSCVKLLSYCDTHLSKYRRPLCFASSYYVYFSSTGVLEIDSCRNCAHDGGHALLKRKYFFCGNKFIKFADFRLEGERLPESVRREFLQEASFLSDMGGRYGFPQVYALEVNADEVWIVRENLPGKLLSEKIKDQDPFDGWEVIRQTLQWLVILEQNGYYSNDVRIWNLLYSPYGKVYLIDYGAIGREQKDCVWPWNLLLSFFMFMQEVLERHYENKIIRGTKMLIALKRYISCDQYLKILDIRENDHCFKRLYDILFSVSSNEKQIRYDLHDEELSKIEDLLEYVGNDWLSHKGTFYRELEKLRMKDSNMSILLDKLTETVINQQERIEALERMCVAKD